jgi:hypothetical protein
VSPSRTSANPSACPGLNSRTKTASCCDCSWVAVQARLYLSCPLIKALSAKIFRVLLQDTTMRGVRETDTMTIRSGMTGGDQIRTYTRSARKDWSCTGADDRLSDVRALRVGDAAGRQGCGAIAPSHQRTIRAPPSAVDGSVCRHLDILLPGLARLEWAQTGATGTARIVVGCESH